MSEVNELLNDVEVEICLDGCKGVLQLVKNDQLENKSACISAIYAVSQLLDIASRCIAEMQTAVL